MCDSALFRKIKNPESDSHIPIWLLEILELERAMPVVAEDRRITAQQVFRTLQKRERLPSKLESTRNALREKVQSVLEIVSHYKEVNVAGLQSLYNVFREDFPIAVLELILHHGFPILEIRGSVTPGLVNEVTEMVAQFCSSACSDQKLTGLRSFPEESEELDKLFCDFDSTFELGDSLAPTS